MYKRQLDDGAASRLGRLHEQGKATVLAAEKDRCLGVIALSDTVRPEAKAAVSQLSSLGAETDVYKRQGWGSSPASGVGLSSIISKIV